MVTNDATITISPGNLILSGMTFLKAEMTKFENIRTASVESPIPSPFIALVVVAKVGHIPSMMIKVGFSLNIPFIILSKYLFILPLPTFPHILQQTPWQH